MRRYRRPPTYDDRVREALGCAVKVIVEHVSDGKLAARPIEIALAITARSHERRISLLEEARRG